MSDITKCSNSKCKIRKTCLRATIKDSIWQSYQTFYPEKDGTCTWFIPNEVKENKK